MSFVETKEQLALQEAAREVVGRVVAPVAAAVPAGQKLSPEDLRRIYKALRPLGYLGSTISRDFGGAGLSYVDYGLLLEALTYGPVVLGEIVPPRTINYLGSEEQKRRWLPKLFSGDWVSTAAITEPQAGSDMRAFKTTATLAGDAYVVNGQKRWIKLGGVSDLMTLMVVDAAGGLSRLVLERAVSPWTSTEMEAVGIRNLSFAELTFDNVRVPKENMLPGVQGLRGPLSCLTQARYGITWGVIGAAQACLKELIAYTATRELFGRPLNQTQTIQRRLADMARRITTAQLLCLQLGRLKDRGRMSATQVSLAKWNNVRMAIDIARDCRDMLGGAGISVEYSPMRHMLNLESVITYEGTETVHELVVGKELTGADAF